MRPIVLVPLALLVLAVAPWGCDDAPGVEPTATSGGGSGANGGSGGGAPLSVPVISSLDTTTAAPAARLTISGSGFEPAANVFAVFEGPDGYEVSVPVIVAGETELEVIVPPFYDLANLTFAEGVVTVRVVQTAEGESVESEPSDELTIEDLPASEVTPGELTAAFFRRLSETMEALRLRLQLMDQFSNGTLAAATLIGHVTALRDAFEDIAEEVDAVVAGSSTGFTIGDNGGEPIVVDAPALEVIDQIIGAAVIQRMGSSGGSVSSQVVAHVATQGSAVWPQCMPGDQDDGTWAATLGEIAREIGGYMGYAGAALGLAAVVTGAPAAATVGITTAVFMATSYVPAAIGLGLDYATGASLTGHADYATFAPSVNYLLGNYIGVATGDLQSTILDAFGVSGVTRVAADEALGAVIGAARDELLGLLGGMEAKSANGDPLLCQPTQEFCEDFVSLSTCGLGALVTCGDGECVPCCEDDVLCAPYSCECGPVGPWGPCG